MIKSPCRDCDSEIKNMPHCRENCDVLKQIQNKGHQLSISNTPESSSQNKTSNYFNTCTKRTPHL